MREMVLDIMEPAAKGIVGKCLCDKLWKLPPLATVPQTRKYQAHIWRMAEHVADLAHSMRTVVHVGGDMVHIAEAQAGFTQAIGDRLRREPRPMLDTTKPLLFGRSHEHAVFE